MDVIGLGFGDRRFAEQIHRKGEVLRAQVLHGGDGLFDIRPRDELAGHRLGVPLRQPSEHPPGETAFGDPADAGAYPARELGSGLVQVFAQVPADFFRIGEVGQSIDKAEELNLQRLVAHGEAHELIVPPRAGKEHGPAAVEAAEDFLPERLSAGFEVIRHRWAALVFGTGGS